MDSVRNEALCCILPRVRPACCRAPICISVAGGGRVFFFAIQGVDRSTTLRSQPAETLDCHPPSAEPYSAWAELDSLRRPSHARASRDVEEHGSPRHLSPCHETIYQSERIQDFWTRPCTRPSNRKSFPLPLEVSLLQLIHERRACGPNTDFLLNIRLMR